MELSPPVFTTYGLSRLGFEHRTFRLRGERSNPLRHRRGWLPSLPSHYHSAKRSALGASVTGPRRWPLMFAPCHSTCGTLKNPHCWMAISTCTEHRSKFAALHRQWWRLQMSEKSSSRMKNTKQTNKQQDQVIKPISFTPTLQDEILPESNVVRLHSGGLWSTHQWLVMQNLKKEVILCLNFLP